MSESGDRPLPGELDELRSVLLQHRPHRMQVGTRTCSYCGGVWDSAQLGDGPGYVYGCAERLDAQLALADAGELPDGMVGDEPIAHPTPKFLRTYE